MNDSSIGILVRVTTTLVLNDAATVRNDVMTAVFTVIFRPVNRFVYSATLKLHNKIIKFNKPSSFEKSEIYLSNE